MSHEHLLPSQVASLAAILAESVLDPSDFSWDQLDSGYTDPTLRFKPNYDYRFFFDQSFQYPNKREPVFVGHRVLYSPGGDRLVEDVSPLKWPQVETVFRHWLENLVREIGARDFWEVIRQHSVGGRPAESPWEQERFTAAEQETLRSELARISEELEALHTGDATVQAHFAREIDELKTAVQTLKRWQWIKLVLGTLAGLVGRHLIPADLARQIIDRIQDILNTPLPVPPTFPLA